MRGSELQLVLVLLLISFTTDWSRNWSQCIAMQNQSNHIITFDAQLKTTLIHT